MNPAPASGAPALFSNDRPGCGPRHIAFHPNGRWVYSINEIDSTIDHFLWTTTSSRTDPQGLLINTGHFVKTIAPGFPAAKNTAAEVAISPDGNYLYASNRGEDTLVVFSIAPADGTLTLVQRISCGGKTPRHFTLSPDEPLARLRQSGLRHRHRLPPRRRHRQDRRPHPDPPPRLRHVHPLRVKPALFS